MYVIFSHPLIALAILLFFCHCLGDYVFQSDFMAQAKNRNTPIGAQFWHWALPAHACIHAGLIFGLTNSVLCWAVEFVSHITLDYLKCENKISLSSDQYGHYLTKIVIYAICVYQYTH